MQASSMDKGSARLYSLPMLRALLIIVTTISLAAASFAVQAHETRMSGMLEHAALTQHIEQASSSMAACSEGESCKADAGLCAFACAGISAWLPVVRTSAKQISSRQKYLLVSTRN
ncbi:hypothetical protein [Brucella anthropi]